MIIKITRTKTTDDFNLISPIWILFINKYGIKKAFADKALLRNLLLNLESRYGVVSEN